MLQAAGGVVAWLGASIAVLADGRRGLAAGIAITTIGVAAVASVSAGVEAAAVVMVGGGVAAFLRNGAGPEGWRLMPPGSTPRLILCIATALVCWWVAASVMTGGGAALHFTALAVTGLGGARILMRADPAVLVTAAAVMTLGIASAVQPAGRTTGLAAYAIAAVIVAAAAFINPPQTHAT